MSKIKKKNADGEGIRLLKHWKKGLFSIIFSRLGIVIILLFIQVSLLFSVWMYFDEVLDSMSLNKRAVYYIVSITFLIIALLILFNSPMDSAAKLSWMLLIAIFPLFGTIFYIWTQIEMGHRSIRHKLNTLEKKSLKSLKQNTEVYENLQNISAESGALSKYLFDISNAPVYTNTDTKYFPLGEDSFPYMCEEIEKAEKFIFIEYFIIEEGYMWGTILEILAKKVTQGVDVRVMYDGTCEFTTLPCYYPKKLAELGIKCQMWEPIKPVLTSAYNYRDHRKILVVDGKTAFCGGVNLADEYINHIVRFGIWKDTSIMIKGSAVDSFTLMFLQMWNVKKHDDEDFTKFLNLYDKNIKADGYVIPYCDSPLSDQKIAERVYMDVLYTAKKYVYIMTPYLVLDDELTTALCYAGQRGIDVRLILPGIPDKKVIWALSKNHYKRLLKDGVKVYEYTPGFIHAKTFLSDDNKAIVGSINLDYRSLYHHFECAAYMHGTKCIEDIKKDYIQTFEKCKEVTFETIKKEKASIKITGAILKLIAPLL